MLASTGELDGYVGGSLAAGGTTHVGRVLRQVPVKERHYSPPGWGWAWG
jgi:hypothetical protein